MFLRRLFHCMELRSWKSSSNCENWCTLAEEKNVSFQKSRYRSVRDARRAAVDQFILDQIDFHLLGRSHLSQVLAPGRKTQPRDPPIEWTFQELFLKQTKFVYLEIFLKTIAVSVVDIPLGRMRRACLNHLSDWLNFRVVPSDDLINELRKHS